MGSPEIVTQAVHICQEMLDDLLACGPRYGRIRGARLISTEIHLLPLEIAARFYTLVVSPGSGCFICVEEERCSIKKTEANT